MSLQLHSTYVKLNRINNQLKFIEILINKCQQWPKSLHHIDIYLLFERKGVFNRSILGRLSKCIMDQQAHLLHVKNCY